MIGAPGLLSRLADLGVTARADAGALRLRPASVIPAELLVELRAAKPELLALLAANDVAPSEADRAGEAIARTAIFTAPECPHAAAPEHAVPDAVDSALSDNRRPETGTRPPYWADPTSRPRPGDRCGGCWPAAHVHPAEQLQTIDSAAPVPPTALNPVEPTYPTPSTPERVRLDVQNAEMVAGLLAASRMRPPAWGDAAALPSPGAYCCCCHGRRWWCEVLDGRGWRCVTCHPADHLAPHAVWSLQT